MGLRTTGQNLNGACVKVHEKQHRCVNIVFTCIGEWVLKSLYFGSSGIVDITDVRIFKLELSGTYDFSSDAECYRYRHTNIEIPVVTRYPHDVLVFRRHPPPGGRSLWKIPRVKENILYGYTVVCNNAFGSCCALRRVGSRQRRTYSIRRRSRMNRDVSNLDFEIASSVFASLSSCNI